MVFASAMFLFLFFPLSFLGYALINPKYRNAWLCLVSLFFYAWGGVQYLLVLLLSIFVNYLIGRALGCEGEKPKRKRRFYLWLGVVFNIGLLGFFKYFNFLTDTLCGLAGLWVPGFQLEVPKVPLPIGISFFTFQILSYVIDVYFGRVKPQKSLLNLALYVALFPQLIAGPIVRYIDVEKQIAERSFTVDRVRLGLQRFVVGLGKKVILSNSMALLADFAFNDVNRLSFSVAWMGAIGYALQIYFDFSAYSDMAIGMGKMFGFDFLENFNYPYISQSVKEFWRRWHISLSSWFRDYVYIPLGGNRKGKARTYLNLLTVFFLTGLWHGASWTFILWGLFHGFFLIAERLGLSRILEKLPRFVRHMYTLVVVLVGWVFFRADTLSYALTYLKTMFTLDFSHFMRAFYLFDREILVYFLLSILLSMPVSQWFKSWLGSKAPKACEPMANLACIFLFFLSLVYVAGSNFNPFIYFIF
ncbi:MAG: MBOAT family protein [Provencibacterium sp.]|nr:MBOAT family protein [Provencibacterium sp.]